jgi:hypothetical protein
MSPSIKIIIHTTKITNRSSFEIPIQELEAKDEEGYVYHSVINTQVESENLIVTLLFEKHAIKKAIGFKS